MLGANNLGSHKGRVYVRVKPLVRASQYFMRTPDAVSDDGSRRCEWGHQVAMVQVEMGTQGLRFEVGKRPGGHFAKLRLVHANPGTKPAFCLLMLLTMAGRSGCDPQSPDSRLCDMQRFPHIGFPSLKGSVRVLGSRCKCSSAEAQNQRCMLQVASDLSSPLAFVCKRRINF